MSGPVERLLIAGNAGGTNMGSGLLRAAERLGVAAELVDTVRAYQAPRIVSRVNWWLRGRRPTRLKAFSREVVERCRQFRPTHLWATGLAPVERWAIDEVRRLGIETIVYLTDDPWNPAFRSDWFLDALNSYDRVYTGRTANIADLTRHGAHAVAFLPFAFDPEQFFYDPAPSSAAGRYDTDVFFAGGADPDRRPFLGALIDAGFTVSLYGDYWERFEKTKGITRGHADPAELRRAIAGAKVCVCLVRRANRDGHSMRSVEVPAAGGCVLAEDTDEHRAIFGASGDAAVFFRTIPDMIDQTRALVADPERRQRLARAGSAAVLHGYTYEDRVRTVLGLNCREADENCHRRPGTLSRV